MLKCKTAITALTLAAIPLTSVVAQTLAPSPVFEGKIATPTKDGAMQPLQVSIQSWAIAGQGRTTQEIPLRGFYVAHLLSGHISAMIDEQTTDHLPGDYWAVKPGVTMQVKVLGEAAVVETTVVRKQ
jgi:hypothetical protein